MKASFSGTSELCTLPPPHRRTNQKLSRGPLKGPLLGARRGASAGNVGSAVCCVHKEAQAEAGIGGFAADTRDAAFMLTGSVLSPADSVQVSRQQQQAAVFEGKQQQHHTHVCGNDSLSEPAPAAAAAASPVKPTRQLVLPSFQEGRSCFTEAFSQSAQ
ncbi:hypothetical protein Efla_007664 [Eimeria flavescens]